MKNFNNFRLQFNQLKLVKGGTANLPVSIPIQDAKVVEKATSGLKDTLKTQV